MHQNAFPSPMEERSYSALYEAYLRGRRLIRSSSPPPKYWEFVALRYILARAQPRTPLGNLQHWLSLSWLPRSLKQKMGLLTRLNKPTYTIFAWYSFVCAYGQLNSRELWGGWLCATIGRGNAASWRWGCRVDAPDLIETSSNWQTRYTCTETYWNIMTR